MYLKSLVSPSAIRSVLISSVSVNPVLNMAVGNFMFFLLTALVAVNLIFAESEHPSQAGSPQDPPPQDGPNQEPNGRFFFNRYVACNYTATPGSTCLNCNTATRCLPSNFGVLRVCRGFLPFCNNGRCSFIAPANCTFG